MLSVFVRSFLLYAHSAFHLYLKRLHTSSAILLFFISLLTLYFVVSLTYTATPSLTENRSSPPLTKSEAWRLYNKSNSTSWMVLEWISSQWGYHISHCWGKCRFYTRLPHLLYREEERGKSFEYNSDNVSNGPYKYFIWIQNWIKQGFLGILAFHCFLHCWTPVSQLNWCRPYETTSSFC
jgi:hypothetical protein